MFTAQQKRREKAVCQSAILFLQASMLIGNAGTINEPHSPEKSPTARDAFQPVPGLMNNQ